MEVSTVHFIVYFINLTHLQLIFARHCAPAQFPPLKINSLNPFKSNFNSKYQYFRNLETLRHKPGYRSKLKTFSYCGNLQTDHDQLDSIRRTFIVPILNKKPPRTEYKAAGAEMPKSIALRKHRLQIQERFLRHRFNIAFRSSKDSLHTVRSVVSGLGQQCPQGKVRLRNGECKEKVDL
ncbi:unnamed protein product [Orchesella dallaii]|uniref:Uncharacterized protein n=1 Tax=Orchesella dallaii TaxID=48710 RepID=A0ABP1RJZ5_9HEXA